MGYPYRQQIHRVKSSLFEKSPQNEVYKKVEKTTIKVEFEILKIVGIHFTNTE